MAWNDDWRYLLAEVYPRVDADGPLRMDETPMEQLGRLKELAPSVVAPLIELGTSLVDLARRGELVELHDLVAAAHHDELLYRFTGRAFEAACAHGQLHACEYMLRRGLMGLPALSNALFSALSAADGASERGGSYDDVRRGVRPPAAAPATSEGAGVDANSLISASFAAARTAAMAATRCMGAEEEEAEGALPASPATTLLWLLSHPLLRLDVNAMRAGDGYTPLHLAALGGLVGPTALLLAQGADAHAAALDGETPLSAAMLARRDWPADDGKAAARFDAVEACLRSRGASSEPRVVSVGTPVAPDAAHGGVPRPSRPAPAVAADERVNFSGSIGRARLDYAGGS
jgi:ankyrin repeat protein